MDLFGLDYRPELLKLGRHLRDMSQRDLHHRTGISQSSLSRAEQISGAALSDLDWEEICNALELPRSFFKQNERVVPSSEPHEMFRKKASAPRSMANQVRAELNVIRMAVGALVESSPDAIADPARLSTLQEGQPSVAEFARRTRHALEVVDGPAHSLAEALEKAGVLVFNMALHSGVIDGVSQWAQAQPPIMLLNLIGDAGRMRFSMAHELGHLVMHAAHWTDGDEEAEANQFAAEFLMPKELFATTFRGLSQRNLDLVKEFYGVSHKAIVYRARELRLISKSDADRFWISYARGRRARDEAVDGLIPPDLGTGAARIIEFLKSSLGMTLEEIASAARVRSEFVTDRLLTPTRALRAI